VIGILSYIRQGWTSNTVRTTMLDMGTISRLNHLIKRYFQFSIAIAVYSHPPSILHESMPLDVSVLLVKVACHFVYFEKDVKTAVHADFKARVTRALW